MWVEARCSEEDGEEEMDTLKEEGRSIEGEEYQKDVVVGTLKKERSTLPSLGRG